MEPTAHPNLEDVLPWESHYNPMLVLVGWMFLIALALLALGVLTAIVETCLYKLRARDKEIAPRGHRDVWWTRATDRTEDTWGR